MKITEIEIHEISVPYQPWAVDVHTLLGGSRRRVVYIVHADNGLTGLGEGWHGPAGGPEPQSVLERYIGTSPFDWIGDEVSFAIGTAMYDLMAKAIGVPVYKLFGPKRRSWVPFSGWTMPGNPRFMAEMLRQYAASGHTWMKFHVSPFENVLEQTRAMQEVAPAGFRVHYDFTRTNAANHMPDLLHRLAEFRVAGCFEDPLPPHDLSGYIELRKRSRLPILTHHAPLNMTSDVIMGIADAYLMAWPMKIGDAIRIAGLLGSINIPFGLQFGGGHITRAMCAHMMSTFPTATFHSVVFCELFADDVVDVPLPVINGYVRVPEVPGLGVTLSREKLSYLEQLVLSTPDRWILKSQYANGTTMYNIHDPRDHRFYIRPEREIPLRYDEPIATEYWTDDGSSEYRMMLRRIEEEGTIIEREE